MRFSLVLFVFLSGFFVLSSCDRNNNFNLIDPQEDVRLGKQLSEEVLNNKGQFPVLDPEAYPESYAYLQNIINTILKSDVVAYREEFPWQVFIIDDDQTLNAFATPGGYIYVYSGLIKYLDTEGDLAGVLGHEIAHADLRHASRQLQKAYGLNFIFNLILGGDEDRNVTGEIVAKLAGQLAGLKFSREYEEEADARSVEYLANTPYPCNAAGVFFKKLEEEEGKEGQIPSFLSTHPHPENRIEKIEEHSKRLDCLLESATMQERSGYQAFQRSLP